MVSQRFQDIAIGISASILRKPPPRGRIWNTSVVAIVAFSLFSFVVACHDSKSVSNSQATTPNGRPLSAVDLQPAATRNTESSIAEQSELPATAEILSSLRDAYSAARSYTDQFSVQYSVLDGANDLRISGRGETSYSPRKNLKFVYVEQDPNRPNDQDVAGFEILEERTVRRLTTLGWSDVASTSSDEAKRLSMLTHKASVTVPEWLQSRGPVQLDASHAPWQVKWIDARRGILRVTSGGPSGAVREFDVDWRQRILIAMRSTTAAPNWQITQEVDYTHVKRTDANGVVEHGRRRVASPCHYLPVFRKVVRRSTVSTDGQRRGAPPY